MSRLIWNAPEGRFFDAGLDRGVLYPKNKPAVAWNGLISVEEEGSEEFVTYYMDGRPYLHMPKPKEFGATIRAFTYPDEFSDIIGLVEATEGFYIDSQVGESFDLAYRTSVGNGVTGSDAGYKIHLIWNATIAPEAVTYETISNSVSPVEFTWQIRAVPVKLNGFRSSAHFIIDTRKLDPYVLEQVETILYGNEDIGSIDGGAPNAIYNPTDLVDGLTVISPLDGEVLDGGGPSTISSSYGLPDPQVIFDLLNYGSDIVITSNGDGTWTARGSKDYVKEIPGGLYQLSNVDVVSTGNGTFTVSD